MPHRLIAKMPMQTSDSLWPRIRALNAASMQRALGYQVVQPTCSGYWPVAESSPNQPIAQSGRSGGASGVALPTRS